MFPFYTAGVKIGFPKCYSVKNVENKLPNMRHFRNQTERLIFFNFIFNYPSNSEEMSDLFQCKNLFNTWQVKSETP